MRLNERYGTAFQNRVHATGMATTAADEEPSYEQRVELARSVWKPGTPVMFIGKSNENDGWTSSLPDAVRSGCAFALQVREDVLALDGDLAGTWQAVTKVQKELLAEGIEPVIIASGQSGRYHLFARVKWRPLREWCAEIGVAAGLDWRHGQKMIRPPLGIHRLHPYVRPKLVSPARVAWALEALSHRRREQLPQPMQDLLRCGDTVRAYASGRSGVEQALLTSMIQHGWTFSDAENAFRNLNNSAGQKYRERCAQSPDAGRRYLAQGWTAAREFVRAHPRAADNKEVVQFLQSVVDSVHATPWRGQTGVTDRAVLLAILDIAQRTAQLVVSASTRQLAELVGRQQHGTICNSLTRLEGRWLRRERVGRGQSASAYRILRTSAAPAATPSTIYEYIGGCEVSGVKNLNAHDAFRYGGLTKSAARIYPHLHPAGFFDTPRDVAARSMVPVTTVRETLKRLRAVGMAERDQYGRWRGIPITKERLDEIAEELGTAGKGEIQRKRFDDDRLWYTGRDPRNPTVFLCLDADRDLDCDGGEGGTSSAAW